MSVLLLHHPRKGASLPGQAARGTGALASHVDIIIEMGWFGKPDDDDRRRWLRAYSRSEETRRHLILERTPAGDDYLGHDAASHEAGTETRHVLSMVLEDADERLTQREILAQWPDDFRKPDQATISRALRKGVEEGQIRVQGSGRKTDPYRYWLPAKESEFDPGANASPEERQRHRQRKWLKSVGLKIDLQRKPTPRSGTSKTVLSEPAQAPTAENDEASSEPPVANSSIESKDPASAPPASPQAAPALPEPAQVEAILEPAPSTAPAIESAPQPATQDPPKPAAPPMEVWRRFRRWPG
jgi:hypothetical protein